MLRSDYIHTYTQAMVHETWLGEYLYSDPRSHMSNLTATAIVIDGALHWLLDCDCYWLLMWMNAGNDHFVTNTIVFSSKIGVSVFGAANLLTGVHTWYCAWSWVLRFHFRA
jgi:hypothetical protein